MTPETIPVAQVLAALADGGTFVPWRVPGEDAGAEAQAVVIGEARVAGRRTALILSDFAVGGGSIGAAAADRIVAALNTATALGLPVFMSPASGGTRVDEGTPAFARMIQIAAAARRHRRSAKPAVAWLRHPTTGGALATWGSLGQFAFAQPGATVAFLGPRLAEPLTGSELPGGVQTAENLTRSGVIDGVASLSEIRRVVARILGAAGPPDADSDEPPAPGTQRQERASTVGELLDVMADVTRLSGTGAGERGDAVCVALGRLNGSGCMVIGHDPAARAAGPAPGPADLRMARRGISLAGELGLPIVTIIETTGAGISKAAEEGGLAGEIARCMADLATVPVPTVSVIAGPGCGGAALALVPADRVLALSDAWIAPLPLAGASVIKFGDVDHAHEMGDLMKIAARELVAAGIADEVIDPVTEPAADRIPAAGPVGGGFLRHIVGRELELLARMDQGDRLESRARRYGVGLRAVPMGETPDRDPERQRVAS